MKQLAKSKKIALIISVIFFIGAFANSLSMLLFDNPSYLKWLNASSLILSLAGLIQLEITGLFEKLFDYYADDAKFPYGPPSHFTRDLVETQNPDKPFRTWLWITAFQERSTGFWMLIISVLLQLIVTALS